LPDKKRLDVVDPREVAVVVLGGGRGTRLYPLTRVRAKPAVNFGGKYRLVDIVMTNCLRSGFDQITILTQFNSFSLNRHIWQTYSRFAPRESVIDVMAAEQTQEHGDWFQGTADAVRKSLRHILQTQPRYVLIVSADQIYSMDYRELILWHLEHRADVTIAARYTPEDAIGGLGIVRVDPDLRVVGFHEKPQRVEDVADFRLDRVGLAVGATHCVAQGEAVPRPYAGKPFLCSMGIYLFDTEVLADALDNREEDFGKSVIPMTAQRRRMSCFPFDGYWEDVGTIASFYKANMEWREGRGIAAIFHEGDSIITHSRQLPPSRIQNTVIEDSIIADGCHIAAQRITRCIIGVRARIGEGCVIEDSILMGNDFAAGPVPFEIGRNCVIRRAILDKGVVLGDGSVIENAEGIQDIDRDLYSIHAGLVVIPKDAVLPPGTRI